MRAIVFDFGAVLFHWSPASLVARQWPALAPDAPAAAALAERFFAGFHGDWAEFDRGVIDRDAIVESVARRAALDRDGVAAVVDAVPGALAPDPATVAWIDALEAEGYPLYFLSNMPAPYVHHLRAHQPVLQRFRGGLFSSEEQLVKPDPRIFERLCERQGLEPGNTVLIDDARLNVEAARRCGWQAVLYRDAAQARAELEAILRSPSSA